MRDTGGIEEEVRLRQNGKINGGMRHSPTDSFATRKLCKWKWPEYRTNLLTQYGSSDEKSCYWDAFWRLSLSKLSILFPIYLGAFHDADTWSKELLTFKVRVGRRTNLVWISFRDFQSLLTRTKADKWFCWELYGHHNCAKNLASRETLSPTECDSSLSPR